MRVGIKVSPLTVLRAGIPNYILHLLRGMAEVDRDSEFFLYTNRALPFELDLPPRFRLVRVAYPAPFLQLWYQLGLPLRMKRDGIDIFHDPVYPLPLLLPVPGVITVHDLSGYENPRVHSTRSAVAAKLYPRHIRVARRIIADSGYTASRIRALFPWAEGKVDVVHLGVSEDFRPVTDREAIGSVRRRYRLPPRFMLFLGTLEPRKNLERLLSAFEAVGGDPCLVIAGGLGWKYGKLMERITRHPFSDRIVMTGFVEVTDLPALLSMAEFLVYPSILEGFGLPILEAMACGTPVITSNTSSMPEVAGDAALLIDPLSTDSIARAMERLAGDEEYRRSLSGQGLERASLFSWRTAAEKTLRIYGKALD